MDGKIRMLMVVMEFPALSETFVLDQITGLIDLGHEVDVLAFSPRNEKVTHAEFGRYQLEERVHYAFSGRKIDIITLFFRKFFTSYRKQNRNLVVGTVSIAWQRVFGKNRPLLGPAHFFLYGAKLSEISVPDVAICHFGPFGDLTVKLKSALSLGFPTATFFHGVDISAHVKSHGIHIYDRLFKEGDLFLPASAFFQRRLLEMGCPPQKTLVQRMGIDLKLFAPQTAQKTEDFVFLSVGRLVEKKGHVDALQAFAKCHAKRPGVAMRLVIIGEGRLRSKIEILIAQHGLKDAVSLLGALSRTEVLQHLVDCNVLVLPSVTGPDGDMEASPVAISEAMAMSRPVLSTFHGGIPEIVEDGATGFLVQEHDVDTLADRMSAFIEDRGLGERMGNMGRSKAVRDLNLDDWNKILAARLENLITTTGVKPPTLAH